MMAATLSAVPTGTVDLFTITDYTGMDPEVARSGALTLGVDTGTYPAPRIVSVGLNLNF